MELSTARNIKRSFYIRAMTNARVAATQTINLWVCGAEAVDVKQSFKLVVYEQGEGGGIIRSPMVDLAESTDPEICPITDYEMKVFDGGKKVPYEGDMVSIDNVNHNLEIKTDKFGRSVIYVKTITKGLIVGWVPVEVEICGGEEISIVPGQA